MAPADRSREAPAIGFALFVEEFGFGQGPVFRLTWRFAALMSHAYRRDDRRDVLTSQPRDIRRMGHDHKMTGEGSSAKTDFEHALLKSCSLLNKDKCLQTLNQPAIHQVTI